MVTIFKNISEDISKNIIADWGIGPLSPEKQEKVIREIGLMIYQALLVRSLDILSIKEQEALDMLLDINTTTTEEVLIFLKSKIPTFDALLKEERQKIKEDILLSS
jgi:hypothetical protein